MVIEKEWKTIVIPFPKFKKYLPIIFICSSVAIGSLIAYLEKTFK